MNHRQSEHNDTVRTSPESSPSGKQKHLPPDPQPPREKKTHAEKHASLHQSLSLPRPIIVLIDAYNTPLGSTRIRLTVKQEKKALSLVTSWGRPNKKKDPLARGRLATSFSKLMRPRHDPAMRVASAKTSPYRAPYLAGQSEAKKLTGHGGPITTPRWDSSVFLVDALMGGGRGGEGGSVAV